MIKKLSLSLISLLTLCILSLGFADHELYNQPLYNDGMQQQYQYYIASLVQQYRAYTGDYQSSDMQVAIWLEQQMMATQYQQPAVGYDHQANMQQIRDFGAQNTANWYNTQVQNDVNHQAFIDYFRQ